MREVSPAADPQSRTYRVKLTLADPGPDVRLGMTGEATMRAQRRRATRRDARRVQDSGHRRVSPGRGCRRLDHSLRPTRRSSFARSTCCSYGERTAYVDRRSERRRQHRAAGVHTVYAGERVKPVKPLFAADDTDGEAAGARPAARREHAVDEPGSLERCAAHGTVHGG